MASISHLVQKSVIDGGDYAQFAKMSKSAKTAHIRELIRAIPLDFEFECSLIERLILENHYYLKSQPLSISLFRKATPPIGYQGYQFEGFFKHIDRWHPVSWTKSINGELSFEHLFNEQARKYISPLLRDYRKNHQTCEVCENAESEEVDHVDPEFSVIAQTALELVTDYDKKVFQAAFDFFSHERCWIPEYHPAIRYIIDRHRTTELKAVCKTCHKLSAKKRRDAA